MKKIEPSEIGKNPDLIASKSHCLQFLVVLIWFILKRFPLPIFNVILEAQREMAQSDILVCGKCHNVFHFIDLFKEHKSNNCKRTSAFNDCVSWLIENFLADSFMISFFCIQRETRPKIWAYLLWKQTQFQQKRENEEDNPWKLYQTWMQLEESTRQSWLVAGGTIQSFERVSSWNWAFALKQTVEILKN